MTQMKKKQVKTNISLKIHMRDKQTYTTWWWYNLFDITANIKLTELGKSLELG